MPAQVKHYSDEPIVVITLPADYNLLTDLPKAVPEYLKLVDALAEPVFWIVDASAIKFTVQEITTGANLLTRSENPLYHHPKIRTVIYVTPNEALQAAAQGLSSEAFGRVAMRVMSTLDEALEYVRGELA